MSTVDELIRWTAQRMGLELGAIDPDQPLTALGLDSLKAAELNTYLEDNHRLTIEVEDLFDGLTLADVAQRIDTRTDEPARAMPQPPIAQPVQSRPVATDTERPSTPQPAITAAEKSGKMDFSLFFFSSDAQQDDQDKYRLFLECAKFADDNGFTAMWSPERHFHKFGGLFPNPSVLGAAIATITKRVRIRAGSVVLPLHDPVRVAEEWSVVDNLSGGRVDIAFATGWNADDFVLAADRYEHRAEKTLAAVETVRTLWRGKTVTLPNGQGEDTDIAIFPTPVQPELPIWITCSGSEERFRQAGALGANIITALLFQDTDELAGKVTAYREARAANGHDPAAGHVTLMLHAFLGTDIRSVRQTVQEPFKRYLEDSVDLWRRGSQALDSLSAKERADVLAFAFERYFHTSALFGTPAGTADRVRQLTQLGVNEIACLIDFGIPTDEVLQGLRHLTTLKDTYQATPQPPASPPPTPQQPATIALDQAVQNRHALAYRQRGGVLQKARDFDLAERLRTIDLLPFYTELTRNEGATCVYQGRTLVMLGSNNYLGLTADKRVREAAADAVKLDGPSLTGSRLLNGSTPTHLDLERKIADFLGHEDALVFTTGYQANIGLLSAIMGNGTTLVADDECHASIYDGAAVGRCNVIQFRHNDVADLDRQLTEQLGDTPGMVMVDGVYSMSGDLAPLQEIREVCDRHGVPLAVDDAHGLGMVGPTGRGIEEEIGTGRHADVLTGTFSKSLASVGGWLAGDKYLMEWIRYHGRSMLFSAAIPPPAVAAAATALDILISEPWRIQQIQEQATYWRAGLAGLGFNIGQSGTAIVPVVIGDEMACMRFAKGLLEGGVYANCVVAPATAPNKALIRTSIMATHEKHHLDTALEIFETVGRAHGLIH